MKFRSMLLMTLVLTAACTKHETPTADGTPATTSEKEGGSAGTGSTGSLGSENPAGADTSTQK
ncbi:MAG: hypothetical protein H7177_06510 [Rhizobacter sp.]|nr:hypothetical protein [Bacteriovorax sp.]